MPETPDTLSPRDREWLALYLELGEDLRALAARLPGSGLIELAFWLRSPAVRAALAAWDSAERRARAVRDEADRQLALEALRSILRARRLSRPDAPAGQPADGPDLAAQTEARRVASTMLRALAPQWARPPRRSAPRSVTHAPHRPATPEDAERLRRLSELTQREVDETNRLVQAALAASAAWKPGQMMPEFGAPGFPGSDALSDDVPDVSTEDWSGEDLPSTSNDPPPPAARDDSPARPDRPNTG